MLLCTVLKRNVKNKSTCLCQTFGFRSTKNADDTANGVRDTYLDFLFLLTVLFWIRVFAVIALIIFITVVVLLNVIRITTAVLTFIGTLRQWSRLAASDAGVLHLSFVGFLNNHKKNKKSTFFNQVERGERVSGTWFCALCLKCLSKYSFNLFCFLNGPLVLLGHLLATVAVNSRHHFLCCKWSGLYSRVPSRRRGAPTIHCSSYTNRNISFCGFFWWILMRKIK